MTSYSLSVAAEDDLHAIWDFIAQDNVFAADAWIEKLFQTFELIARNPAIGHTRDDLTSKPVRFWPVGSYLIIYRLHATRVEIVGVTHGGRDIPRFLTTRK